MSSDDMSTEPTIGAVLERVNAIGQQLMAEIQSQGASNEAQFNELRTRLRRVERQIEILNDNILKVQGDQRDLLVRVEDIESKNP